MCNTDEVATAYAVTLYTIKQPSMQKAPLYTHTENAGNEGALKFTNKALGFTNTLSENKILSTGLMTKKLCGSHI